MAKAKPAKSEQTTKVELPPWVEAAGRQNYNMASNIAARPYEAYGGPLVAPLTDSFSTAKDLVHSTVGADPNSARASEAFGDAASGFKGAGVLSGADISQYMNPYITNVENRALDALGRERESSLAYNADAAAKAGSFGGSRHGVIDALTNAESSRAAGDLSARLRASGYEDAVSRAQMDIENRRASASGLLGAGGGFLDTASTDSAKRLQDLYALLDIGGTEQANAQAGIDADYGQFLEKRNHPIEALNLKLAALGLTPYGQTQESSGTQTAGRPGVDPFTTALGVAQTAAGIFSDRDAKTDIEKLGKDPVTGLNLYAYRYKKDPKTYPKVVGPMAQEIEKLLPDAVRKVGNRRMVVA